jgi:4-hydroxybenzoate polyprenyltransferase
MDENAPVSENISALGHRDHGDSNGAARTVYPTEVIAEDRAGANRQNGAAYAETPLVIDLDGTLLRSNALFECLLVYLKQNPLGVFRLPLWLAKGRANLKRQLAKHAPLTPATLPLNEEVLAYAVDEKAKGRQVWLATAADRSIAEPIAERCQCFDGVLASDGQTNLKGRNKAERLSTIFASGFAYAGDSMADLPVWSRAKEIIVVGGSPRTTQAALGLRKPTQVMPRPSRLRALIKCARPHQWAKNVLVFVPAILSGTITQPNVLLATLLSFIALSLVASSTYILNDLWDLADDREHWSKRRRPIASGALPISYAMAAAPVGLAAGLLLALTVAPAVFAALFAYLVLTLAYTYRMKRVPVLDVTTLAGLFTLRLVLGITSAGVFASPWLLTFSMFLFASLCFAKRYVEIEGAAARGKSTLSNRGYQVEDIPLLVALGLGTGTASIVIMVLYIIFDAFPQSFYGNSTWLWAFPIIIFLWVSRLWLMALRKQLDDDPVAFAVSDRPSIALGAAMVMSFIFAWSGLFA